MKWLLLLISMIGFSTCYAQEPGGELEYQLESLGANGDELPIDLTQIAEDLELLKESPVILNFATDEDLRRIPYLNIFQINNLLQYRARSGMIYSIYELMAVKGFDRELIERISPYLDLRTEMRLPKLKFRQVWKYSRHNILARTGFDLRQREGFIRKGKNGYLGDKGDLYLRYKGRYRDLISWNLTAQHDAGEPFGRGYQRLGFDFVSAHFALNNYGPLRSFIIGDFQAEFGQGLAFWSGMSMGKSLLAVDVKKFARGFTPFGGAEENRCLRGTAATLRLGKIDISAFYSSRKIDANISSRSLTGEPNSASSLPTTGLHRTMAELEDEDVANLRISGGNLNYKTRRFSIGATAVNYLLNIDLEPGKQPYQYYNFSGRHLTNLSLDLNYLYSDINIFGEIAYSNNGGVAVLGGFQSNPHSSFYYSLIHRHIPGQYQAIYTSPFSESGKYGEEGTYLGIKWNLSRIFSFTGSVDLYHFNWLRFGAPSPTSGHEILTQLEMDFSRYMKCSIRFNFSGNQVGESVNKGIKSLIKQETTGWRFNIRTKPHRNWELNSRIDFRFHKMADDREKGLLIYQDVKYTTPSQKWKFAMRYAIVDTRSYATRIYTYENDLSYAFSVPPYYGQAQRFYVLSKWKITPSIEFQLKYSVTKFFDRDEISSGLNKISGDRLPEIKTQIIVKL